MAVRVHVALILFYLQQLASQERAFRQASIELHCAVRRVLSSGNVQLRVRSSEMNL